MTKHRIITTRRIIAALLAVVGLGALGAASAAETPAQGKFKIKWRVNTNQTFIEESGAIGVPIIGSANGIYLQKTQFYPKDDTNPSVLTDRTYTIKQIYQKDPITGVWKEVQVPASIRPTVTARQNPALDTDSSKLDTTRMFASSRKVGGEDSALILTRDYDFRNTNPWVSGIIGKNWYGADALLQYAAENSGNWMDAVAATWCGDIPIGSANDLTNLAYPACVPDADKNGTKQFVEMELKFPNTVKNPVFKVLDIDSKKTDTDGFVFKDDNARHRDVVQVFYKTNAPSAEYANWIGWTYQFRSKDLTGDDKYTGNDYSCVTTAFNTGGTQNNKTTTISNDATYNISSSAAPGRNGRQLGQPAMNATAYPAPLLEGGVLQFGHFATMGGDVNQSGCEVFSDPDVFSWKNTDFHDQLSQYDLSGNVLFNTVGNSEINGDFVPSETDTISAIRLRYFEGRNFAAFINLTGNAVDPYPAMVALSDVVVTSPDSDNDGIYDIVDDKVTFRVKFTNLQAGDTLRLQAIDTNNASNNVIGSHTISVNDIEGKKTSGNGTFSLSPAVDLANLNQDGSYNQPSQLALGATYAFSIARQAESRYCMVREGSTSQTVTNDTVWEIDCPELATVTEAGASGIKVTLPKSPDNGTKVAVTYQEVNKDGTPKPLSKIILTYNGTTWTASPAVGSVQDGVFTLTGDAIQNIKTGSDVSAYTCTDDTCNTVPAAQGVSKQKMQGLTAPRVRVDLVDNKGDKAPDATRLTVIQQNGTEFRATAYNADGKTIAKFAKDYTDDAGVLHAAGSEIKDIIGRVPVFNENNPDEKHCGAEVQAASAAAGQGSKLTRCRYSLPDIQQSLPVNAYFKVVASKANGNIRSEEVTAVVKEENVRNPIDANAPTLTALKAENHDRDDNGTADVTVVSGSSSEPGAAVVVKDAAGKTLGQGVVNASGNFSITLTPAQAIDSTLQLSATDASGNSTQSQDVTWNKTLVKAGIKAPEVSVEQWDTDGDNQADKTVGTVVTEAGATVTFDAPSKLQADYPNGIKANDQGVAAFEISPALNAGETVKVTTTSKDNSAWKAQGQSVVSAAAPLDKTPPAQPEINSVISVDEDANGEYDYSKIQGLAEKDSEVEIYRARDLENCDTSNPTAEEMKKCTLKANAARILSITAASDGTFRNLKFTNALPIKYSDNTPFKVVAVAIDKAGNRSIFSAPKAVGEETAPKAETPSLNLQNQDVTGTDEADLTNATGKTVPEGQVRLSVSDGRPPVFVTANAEGIYSHDFSPVLPEGTQVTAVAVAPQGGVNSEPVSKTVNADVVDKKAPAAPVLTEAVNIGTGADAKTAISGTAEPGSTVMLDVNRTGTANATVKVGDNGKFTAYITPQQNENDVVIAKAKDDNDNLSPISNEITIKKGEDAIKPPRINTVSAQDTNGDKAADQIVVSGTTQPGATVTVTKPDGTTQDVTADGNGDFTVTIPVKNGKPSAGDAITAVAKKGTDTSKPAQAVIGNGVDDKTAPGQPTVVAQNQTVDGKKQTKISGRAEPNSKVFITANGKTVEWDVSPTGEYAFTCPIEGFCNAQADGNAVTVVAVDAAGNPSDPAQTTVKPVAATSVPDAPIVSIENRDTQGDDAADETLISGQADPGNVVLVYVDGKEEPITITPATDGSFSTTLKPALAAGTQVKVVQKANKAGATASEPNSQGVPTETKDKKAPDAPSIKAQNLDTDDDNVADKTQITGKAEPNSTVEIYDANNKKLASAKVNENGDYSLNLPETVQDDAILTAVAVDESGNRSLPAEAQAGKVTVARPDKPTVVVKNVDTNGDGVADETRISGVAQPNNVVKVTAGEQSGAHDCQETAKADGSYSCVLKPVRDAGTKIYVTGTDKETQRTSLPAYNAVPTEITDESAPAAPTVSSAENPSGTNHTVVKGTAEPNAEVEIDTNGDGKPDATVTADANGNFAAVIRPAALQDAAVKVTAVDAAGNRSPAATVTATEAATAPAPTIIAENQDTNGDGKADQTVLKGTGAEPNAEVTVTYTPEGSTEQTVTVTADANGEFEVPVAIKPALTEGGDVTAKTDKSGKGTGKVSATVDAQPTQVSKLVVSNQDSNNDGIADQTVVSGTATAGSTVLIDVNGDGKPDYEAVADKDGNFVRAIPVALAEGTEVAANTAPNAHRPQAAAATASVGAAVKQLAQPHIEVSNNKDGARVIGTAPGADIATVCYGTPEKCQDVNVDGNGEFAADLPEVAAGDKVTVTGKPNNSTQSSPKAVSQVPVESQDAVNYLQATQEAVAKAVDKAKALYKNASPAKKAAYDQALQAAQEAVANANGTITAPKYAKDLLAAIDALDGLDKETLQQFVDDELGKANNLPDIKTTPLYKNADDGKKAAYDKALAAAQAALTASPTTQAALDKAYSDLQTARDALDGKPVSLNKEDLAKALEDAQKAMLEGKYRNDTPENQRKFDDAVKAAQAVLDQDPAQNPQTQGEINDAAAALRDAINNLKGDVDPLQRLRDLIAKKAQAPFKDANIASNPKHAAYQQALEKAEQVANQTSPSRDEINTAYNNLKTAMDAITADAGNSPDSELQRLIDKATKQLANQLPGLAGISSGDKDKVQAAIDNAKKALQSGNKDDIAKALAQLGDSDADNIPNVIDNIISNEALETSVGGVGSFGVWSLLALFVGALRARGKALLAVLLAATGAANANDVLDDHGRFYVGAGVGVSMLNPKIVGQNKLELKDKNDFAYRLHAGFNFTPNWAVELNYAGLGKAILDGSKDPGLINRYGKESELTYSAVGLGAIYYPQIGDNGYGTDSNLNYFVELGLDTVINDNPASASDKIGLPYKSQNGVSLLLGAGLEYEFTTGLAARVMAESYANDAALVSVGLNYHPQRQRDTAPEPVIEEPIILPEPEPAPAPVPVVIEPVVVEPVVVEAAPQPAPIPATEAIKTAVFDWARAWAEKDIPAYLDSYVPEFNNDSNNKQSPQEWRAFRTKRLSAPGYISLDIEDITITERDPNHAKAVFKQTYQSNLYKDVVIKELQVRRNDALNKWQITSEKVLSKVK